MTFWQWLCGVRHDRVRQPGESCATCCHFIDSRDTEPPDECNGYCGELVDRLGFQQAVAVDGYGGHWTHDASWCCAWEGGPTNWPANLTPEAPREEPPT